MISSRPSPPAPSEGVQLTGPPDHLTGPALLDWHRLNTPRHDGHGGDYLSTSLTGSLDGEYEEYINQYRFRF